jgi:hypothetical protein
MIGQKPENSTSQPEEESKEVAKAQKVKTNSTVD